MSDEITVLYDTATLMGIVNRLNLEEPNMFFTDTFFNVGENIEGEFLQVDIFKDARRIAEFINPKLEGDVFEKMPFKTETFKPPYIKMISETSAHDLLKRRAGETIYRPGVPPAQLAAQKLAVQMRGMVRAIKRKIELEASEALLDGKVTFLGRGVDGEIDFERESSHTVTLAGPDLWSDSASKPVDNILDWLELISLDSGRTGTKMVVGHNVYKAMLNNAQVQQLLDVRRITLGQMDATKIPKNATFHGTIHGVEVWTYKNWYLDNTSGLNVPYMPTDKVLLAAPKEDTDNKLHYGAIRDLKAGVVAEPFFSKSWEKEEPSAQMLKVESSPFTALHEPDTTLIATVL